MPGVLRPFDQPQPPDDHDVAARGQEGLGLSRGRPVQFEQQPGRGDLLEVSDQRMHERARIGRVRDDRIGLAVAVERECVLTGTDVALVDAAQPERFR